MLREMRLLLALRRLPGKWLTPTQNSAGDRRRFPDPPQRVRYSNQVFGDLDRRRFFGRLSPAGILAYATIISPSTWRFGTRGAIRDAKCPASRDRARSNQSLPSPTARRASGSIVSRAIGLPGRMSYRNVWRVGAWLWYLRSFTGGNSGPPCRNGERLIASCGATALAIG